MISMLVARARNGVIGKDNGMPWYIPEDLKYFRQLTTGSSIVMGRKTYTAIGQALPNRWNYVLTTDKTFQAEGVHVLHRVSDILSIPGDVFIIGGASIFKQAMHLAERMYVTDIHADVEGDTYIDMDLSHWSLQTCTPGNQDQHHRYNYDFKVYVRKDEADAFIT